MFEYLKNNYAELGDRITAACTRCGRSSDEIRLVAITKTFPVEPIQAVIDLGITEIGENRVQELQNKVPRLRGEPTMHLVGHLQSNKVDKAVRLVSWIDSIDSARCADKVDCAVRTLGKDMNVLVQVNTSGEDSKSGCPPRECRALCEHIAQRTGLLLHGLMTIGPLHGDEKATRNSFAVLRCLRDECAAFFQGSGDLSMGMSGDFEWAIEEGATMIRIGSLLLGNRNY